MFENPRRGRRASNKFYKKCCKNSRSQIVFRTDILPKTVVGCPWKLNKFECGTSWPPDILRKHWFTASVWNFCRWVADVSPRETSPGAKSEEKRLFSETRTTVTLMIYATFLYNDYWGWNHLFLIENPNDSGPLKEQLTERIRIEMTCWMRKCTKTRYAWAELLFCS